MSCLDDKNKISNNFSGNFEEKIKVLSYDKNIWLRSCEQEIVEPINGVLSGKIPVWINGSLLRNGPGALSVGEDSYNHIFDAASLLHRFNIADGNVTYQCRFLKSDTYKKNHAANRIVVSEFATTATLDPCQSIFSKISSMFQSQPSDNTLVSIYPFNDEFFAFAEYPFIHQIDPETLETKKKVDFSDKFGVLYHTSHPHVISDGTVYNLGLSLSKFGPVYNIICFPKGENIFNDAKVVVELPVRWKFHPSYMHTFGITENFFIIVEQPLVLSVKSILKTAFNHKPFITCFQSFQDKSVKIHLIDRVSGKLRQTFDTETFFFFHIINQFEKNGHVVIDIICYKDFSVIDSLYIDSIKNGLSDPLMDIFQSETLRFVLPLNKPNESKGNIVTLENTAAVAFLKSDGSVFCKPEILCDIGCELPRINYEKYLGKDYQFFYALSATVELENAGILVKGDVRKKTKLIWSEKNCYPSEPVFIASPEPKSEDDGVIVASMIWGNGEENRVGLLVLDAKTMTEKGRCEFNNLPGPVPKCFHGWFARKKL